MIILQSIEQMSFGISFPPSVYIPAMFSYRIAEDVTLAGSFANTLMPLELTYQQGIPFTSNPSTGKYVFTRAGTYRVDLNSGGTLCESGGSDIWAELYDSTDTIIEKSSATYGQACAGSATFMTFSANVNDYVLIYYRGDPALTTTSANTSKYQVVMTKLG